MRISQGRLGVRIASTDACLPRVPGVVYKRQVVRMTLKLTIVGGPTALLEYAGLRWLTDPAFSPRGEYAGGLVKTSGPAIEPELLAPTGVVLLSHEST